MSQLSKCQATTLSKKQCSRNALCDQIYCSQHLKMYQKLQNPQIQTLQISTNQKLVQEAIQPKILEQIILYSGNISNTAKSVQIPKEKIINSWLLEIGVKRDLKILTPKDYQLLWPLYQTRIDNRPRKELLDKAIQDQGLIENIFYSQQHNFGDTIPELEDNSYSIDDIKFVNSRLVKFIETSDLKIGDTVRLMQYGEYRNSGVLLYDGKKLVNLDDEIDDYGAIPLLESFNIIEYPISEYFSNTIDHNNMVVMKSENVELEILQIFKMLEGKELNLKLEKIAYHSTEKSMELFGSKCYKYRLLIGENIWIIYSPDTSLYFNDLKYFDATSFNMREYEDFFPGLSESIMSEKGSNILYDIIRDTKEKIILELPKKQKKIC